MKALPLVVLSALVLVSWSSSAVDFTLRPVARTATTVTFTWKRQSGADGYAFVRNGVPVARTLDPSQTTATFWKGSRYAVDVLHVSGGGRVHARRTRGLHSADEREEDVEHESQTTSGSTRVRARPEPCVHPPSRRAYTEDRYLRLETITRRRRLPVRSEREDRLADFRPLALAGHVLEGFPLCGRGASFCAGETGLSRFGARRCSSRLVSGARTRRGRGRGLSSCRPGRSTSGFDSSAGRVGR